MAQKWEIIIWSPPPFYFPRLMERHSTKELAYLRLRHSAWAVNTCMNSYVLHVEFCTFSSSPSGKYHDLRSIVHRKLQPRTGYVHSSSCCLLILHISYYSSSPNGIYWSCKYISGTSCFISICLFCEYFHFKSSNHLHIRITVSQARWFFPHF